MRALSTCLSVILGVSVCYLAACSSDSDTGGAGGGGGLGEAGETSSAGAGDTSGAAGAAGASSGACAFESDACVQCLTGQCADEVQACSKATDCQGALSKLDGCACGGDMTALMCETTFIGDGGDAAQPLADCFNQNCASVCAK